MKIFIDLPTWLGDSIMASAGIYALKEFFKDGEFVFYGSFTSIELFREFPNSTSIVCERKRRFSQILKLNKNEKFDLAFSFRSALSAKLTLFLLRAKKKFTFDKNQNKEKHQVLKYLYFIENALGFKAKSQNLNLPFKIKKETKQSIGLNPGAHFGCAKRWKSEYFIQTASAFKDYEILIFGVKEDEKLCEDIEKALIQKGLKVQNLCAKTSIKELCEKISSLSLFISNDSGPMHIGAVYKIKTLALFGPTKFTQTSPWENQNAKILHLDLPCMPCMQRTCPLKHHKCMEDLKPEIVIKQAKILLQKSD